MILSCDTDSPYISNDIDSILDQYNINENKLLQSLPDKDNIDKYEKKFGEIKVIKNKQVPNFNILNKDTLKGNFQFGQFIFSCPVPPPSCSTGSN